MSDAYRKKFPQGPDWKEPEPNPFGEQRISSDSYHGMEIIGLPITKSKNVFMCDYKSMSKKELEEFADKMRIERNSFLLEKERLEERIKELETELYFCNRNKRIGEIVDRQRLL